MIRLELGLNYRVIKHVNTDSQSVDWKTDTNWQSAILCRSLCKISIVQGLLIEFSVYRQSNDSQASTRIPNSYHTVTACDRVTSQCRYRQDFALFSFM